MAVKGNQLISTIDNSYELRIREALAKTKIYK